MHHPVVAAGGADGLESVPDLRENLCVLRLSHRDQAALHSTRMVSATRTAPAHGQRTETPMTLDALQDEFIKLRDQAIWVRQTVNTFSFLFDSGPETERVLKESACLFFGDLNTMMQEYAVLLVCRLTGPAQSFRKANLSTQRFTMLLRDEGRLTPEIERLDASLREYGGLLKPARDKIIAHSDLEVHVNSTVLGAHGEEVMLEFLENLQAYFDSVGNVIGVGPLDFRSTPGTGDVIDLVRKLKKANDAAAE